MLEETVVVGYGVQKKSVVTASISKVDGEALNTVRACQKCKLRCRYARAPVIVRMH